MKLWAQDLLTNYKINSTKKINFTFCYITLLSTYLNLLKSAKKHHLHHFMRVPSKLHMQTQKLYWNATPRKGGLSLFTDWLLTSCIPALKPSYFKLKPLQNYKLLWSLKSQAYNWNWEYQIKNINSLLKCFVLVKIGSYVLFNLGLSMAQNGYLVLIYVVCIILHMHYGYDHFKM